MAIVEPLYDPGPHRQNLEWCLLFRKLASAKYDNLMLRWYRGGFITLPPLEYIGESSFDPRLVDGPAPYDSLHEIVIYRVPPFSLSVGCVVLPLINLVMEAMDNSSDYRVTMTEEFLTVALARNDPANDEDRDYLSLIGRAAAKTNPGYKEPNG